MYKTKMDTWYDYPDSDHLMDLETDGYQSNAENYYLDKTEHLMTNQPSFHSVDPFVAAPRSNYGTSKTNKINKKIHKQKKPSIKLELSTDLMLLLFICIFLVIILAELYSQDQKIAMLLKALKV